MGRDVYDIFDDLCRKSNQDTNIFSSPNSYYDLEDFAKLLAKETDYNEFRVHNLIDYLVQIIAQHKNQSIIKTYREIISDGREVEVYLKVGDICNYEVSSNRGTLGDKIKGSIYALKNWYKSRKFYLKRW